MAMGNGGHHESSCALVRGLGNEDIPFDDRRNGDHAHPKSAMRAVEYKRPFNRAACPSFSRDIILHRFRHGPAAFGTRVWTDLRLDAIDRARPGCKADIMLSLIHISEPT